MTKKKSLAWPNSFSWSNCTEAELETHLREWLSAPGVKASLDETLIFLDGEMGAGKSTFVRALLAELAPGQTSQGSPTFPIVQEYRTAEGRAIYHLDLYRLKSEDEIHDSGIDALLDQEQGLICIEWATLFESYFDYWRKPTARTLSKRKVLEVTIGPAANGDPLRREINLNGSVG